MTVTVTKLTKSQHMEDRWYVELSTGETLKAGVNLIADFSIYTGREYDGSEYERLRAAASQGEARARALRILGARQLSKKELTKRLVEKGETESDAESAVEALEGLGVLNDAEYAASIVRHYTKMGYGPGRVRDELYRRGVPKELWEEALAENLPEDEDSIGALLEKKLRGRTPDRKELKRVTDMLLRRGFSWSAIKKALSEYDFSEEFDGTDD